MVLPSHGLHVCIPLRVTCKSDFTLILYDVKIYKYVTLFVLGGETSFLALRDGHTFGITIVAFRTMTPWSLVGGNII